VGLGAGTGAELSRPFSRAWAASDASEGKNNCTMGNFEFAMQFFLYNQFGCNENTSA